MVEDALSSIKSNNSRYSLVVGNFWGARWNYRAFVAPADLISINQLKADVYLKYANYPTWNIHENSCRIVTLAELKSYKKIGDIDIIYLRTVNPKNGEVYFVEVNFA